MIVFAAIFISGLMVPSLGLSIGVLLIGIGLTATLSIHGFSRIVIFMGFAELRQSARFVISAGGFIAGALDISLFLLNLVHSRRNDDAQDWVSQKITEASMALSSDRIEDTLTICDSIAHLATPAQVEKIEELRRVADLFGR